MPKSKPRDPRPASALVPVATQNRLRELLAKHKRIAIVGGSRTGKSKLAELAEQWGRRVFFAEEFEELDHEMVPHGMLAATRDLDEFVIEGVMTARYLRKAHQLKHKVPVDAVILLERPKVQQSSGQVAQAKGINRIFAQWRRWHPWTPVYRLDV